MALYVDIEKKCGNFLLKVKFTAEKEVLGLLGASGCGKSMTLKCIAGIEKPDKGVIRLDDKVFFDSEKRIHLPVQKRRVGYLFQDYALFPNMTVLQNILCGAGDRKKASEYVKRFFLEGMLCIWITEPTKDATNVSKQVSHPSCLTDLIIRSKRTLQKQKNW